MFGNIQKKELIELFLASVMFVFAMLSLLIAYALIENSFLGAIYSLISVSWIFFFLSVNKMLKFVASKNTKEKEIKND